MVVVLYKCMLGCLNYTVHNHTIIVISVFRVYVLFSLTQKYVLLIVKSLVNV